LSVSGDQSRVEETTHYEDSQAYKESRGGCREQKRLYDVAEGIVEERPAIC